VTLLIECDRQALMGLVARFNRKILNPFTMSFAGRPYSPYAIIQHVGRKSGRTYATPILAERTEEGFVIPLPYGEGTDWHRNVQTAGEARITSQGQVYHVAQPEVVEAREGVQVFHPVTTWLLESAKVEKYLRVKRVPDAPLGQAAYAQIIKDYPITRALKMVGGAAALVVALAVLAKLFKRKD
jgi:deazaflavin-dependent oxidoreductase (nitroreductase family)